MPADGYDWKMGRPSVLDGEPVDVVTLNRGDTKSAEYGVLTLAISRHDHLLRQITDEYHHDRQPVERHTETLLDIKVNPSLPASLFVFTPPPGSHPVPLASDLVARR